MAITASQLSASATPSFSLTGVLGSVTVTSATATRLFVELRQPPVRTVAGAAPIVTASLSVQKVQRLQLTAATQRTRYATPGVPTTLLRKPQGLEENSEQLWDRLQGNWGYLVSRCIADTSATTYITGWRHWLQMCQLLQADPFLQHEQPALMERRLMPIRLPYNVVMALSFIGYLASADRKLKATTIVDYMSAIGHFLASNLVDVTFLSHPSVRRAKSALAVEERYDVLQLDTKSLAFSADMIVFYRTQLMNPLSIQDTCCAMAMALQFTALNRVSEIIPTAADYYARAMDIEFECDLSTTGTGTDPTTWTLLRADAIWDVPIERLRGMNHTIRGSKTDQNRQGFTMHFDTLDEADPAVAFCVAKLAFRWAQEARPTGQDAFLSYRSKWVLDYETYNKSIKLTARRMGINEARMSTHSVRIGGASALAAAGLPNWQIMKLGRWKSLAFLGYIQVALSSMRTAQVAMVTLQTFTINDTRRLHGRAQTDPPMKKE